jgi:hypothetical protein
MVETEYRLDVSYTVTIASNGVGVITSVGPPQPTERWQITSTSVSATGQCAFTSYRGNEPNVNNQIDFTRQGIGDTSDSVISVAPQEKISFQFSGTPGIICTVVLSGSRHVKGRRAY